MRMLSGLTVLSIAVVAVVILFSGADGIQHALRPLERTPAQALRSHSSSPLLAQRVTVDQTFHDLYMSARLEAIGGTLAPRQLLAALRQENPDAEVGRPLRKGGITVRLLGGTMLELCALTTSGYHCSDRGLTGASKLGYGDGATLALARRAARPD